MWASVDVYRLTSLESMQQWSDDSIAAGQPINNFNLCTVVQAGLDFNDRDFVRSVREVDVAVSLSVEMDGVGR